MTVFKNIRTWIFLFFLVRLVGITNPPLEVSHNWRQTTVTMVARNFYEGEANLFYPAIDIAGEKPGITGMEFPVLNYLIYLVSLVFGYAHWYGRLINLVVSSFGLLYFYKLSAKYFSASTAFNATILLLFSLWFTYSRKIMPDTFSVSLIFFGLHFGTNYLDGATTIRNLLLSFLFILLGALSKLPSAYLLVLFIPFAFNKRSKTGTKVVFFMVSGFAMILTLLYYLLWVPYLNAQFGFEHFYMGTGLVKGLREIATHWPETLEKFYLDALQISGFLIFLAGLWLMLKQKHTHLRLVFVLTSLCYSVLMVKAGFAFYHHAYYILPFVPVMALVAGNALGAIKSNKLRLVLLLVFCAESILNKTHDFFIKDNFAAVTTTESQLDQLGHRSDLIVINSGNVPTPMYFAHRKGWVTFNQNLQRAAYIDSLKNLGLKHIVVLKNVFGEHVELNYNKSFQNEDFTLYSP